MMLILHLSILLVTSLLRKIATSAKSEKLVDLIIIDNAVYFVLETADSSSSNDVRLAFGKATVGTSEYN